MQWEMESLASCNAMQPTCLHLVLVFRREPSAQPAAREHFPLGAKPYSPSLSLNGLCTGHSGKATMPSAALHRMPGKATVHPIRTKRAALFCQICSCIVLLLLFFLQSWLLFLSIMLICYNSIQLDVLFHPITTLCMFTPSPLPEFSLPFDGLNKYITLFQVSDVGHYLQSFNQPPRSLMFLMQSHVIVGINVASCMSKICVHIPS